MAKPEIEEFARIIVRRVRDVAIQAADRNLLAESNYPVALRWKTAVESNDPELLATVISDCVDETLFQLLSAIDQEELNIVFVPEEGLSVNLSRDGLGELAGNYLGSDGWRAAYSGTRYIDDFSDLNDIDDA